MSIPVTHTDGFPEPTTPSTTHASTPGVVGSIPTVLMIPVEDCSYCGHPFAKSALTHVHGHGWGCWTCIELEREAASA